MEVLKYFLPALILLTQLDGEPVWVESNQTAIIKRSLDCAHKKATAIMVQGKPLCVREPLEDVADKIKKANEGQPW